MKVRFLAKEQPTAEQQPKASAEPAAAGTRRVRFLNDTGQQEAQPAPTMESFISGMKQLMAEGVKQRFAQERAAEGQAAEAKRQEMIQAQMKQIEDQDPRTWASSRFKKEFPKPRTAEEQVFYDMMLEKKLADEGAIRKKIEGMALSALGPGPLAAPIAKGYGAVREAVSGGLSELLPETPGMDKKQPISAPNPMFPQMPQLNIPLGKMSPRESVKELAGMGVDEVATLGAGRVVRAGAAIAKKAGEVPRLTKIVEEGIMKGVKPSVARLKNIAGVKQYVEKAETAVGAIVENKAGLGLTDEGGEAVEKLPESVKEFGDSIASTKKSIFKKYDALAKKANAEGLGVDMSAVGKDVMQSLSASQKVLKAVAPETLAYAKKRALGLKKSGYFTATQAQDAVEVLNKSLEAYYRNPSYETASKAVVDAGVANSIRRLLDKAMDMTPAAWGADKSYAALKRIYGALKTIEADVAKRFVVEARKSGVNLIDFTDIFSGAEIVRGLVTMNPGAIAAGASARTIKEMYKRFKSPDRAIKLMFRKYEKALSKSAVKNAGSGDSGLLPAMAATSGAALAATGKKKKRPAEPVSISGVRG